MKELDQKELAEGLKKSPKKAVEPVKPIPAPVSGAPVLCPGCRRDWHSMDMPFNTELMRCAECVSADYEKTKAGGANGADGSGFRVVPAAHLIPREDNPRRIDVKADSFRALVASICSAGIITPLIGRPHPERPECVELLAGHRRRLAGLEADLTEFPVIVRAMDDRTAMEVLVFENLDRENLTPLEEARGVQLMLNSGHDGQEIADRMGKTRQWVARRANLLNLTKKWQEWAEETGVSAAHLELIARWPRERQDDLYGRLEGAYDSDKLWMGPGSVKVLAAEIADEMRELLKAPWNLDDATLVAKAGACALCPKRSGCQPDLFSDENEDGGDRCLDPDCWADKMEAHKERREVALRKEHPGLVKVIGKGGSNYYRGKRLTGVLDQWEYEKCTQKSPGAVPAMVVSGDGEGTLIWVKPKSSGSSSASTKLQSAAAKQAEASQDPQACEKILAEKREGLERRRTAWVIQKLLKLLMEADRPAGEFDTHDGYMALVAGFGTKDLGYGEEVGEDVPESWGTSPSAGVEVRRTVWEMVKPRIRDEIFFESTGGIAERHREGVRWIAKLLGASLEVLKEEAEKEIPEPKSWEQLQKLAEAPAPKSEPKESKGEKKQTTKKKGNAA